MKILNTTYLQVDSANEKFNLEDIDTKPQNLFKFDFLSCSYESQTAKRHDVIFIENIEELR